MSEALTYHARYDHTEEQRAAARALLDELAQGCISRTAACRAITAAATRRKTEKEAKP